MYVHQGAGLHNTAAKQSCNKGLANKKQSKIHTLIVRMCPLHIYSHVPVKVIDRESMNVVFMGTFTGNQFCDCHTIIHHLLIKVLQSS